MKPRAIHDARRALGLTLGVGLALLGAVGIWALRPLGIEPSLPAPIAGGVDAREHAGDPDAPLAVPLDAALFARRLSPEPPAPEGQPNAPVGRLASLSLIAVSRVDGVLVAAIYDATDDRVHLLRSGDRVGEVEIASVLEREVALREGDRQLVLRLVDASAGARIGGGA